MLNRAIAVHIFHTTGEGHLYQVSNTLQIVLLKMIFALTLVLQRVVSGT